MSRSKGQFVPLPWGDRSEMGGAPALGRDNNELGIGLEQTLDRGGVEARWRRQPRQALYSVVVKI